MDLTIHHVQVSSDEDRSQLNLARPGRQQRPQAAPGPHHLRESGDADVRHASIIIHVKMLNVDNVDSLQKLAVDLARSSEALKQWGAGEGDDLGVSADLQFRRLWTPQ